MGRLPRFERCSRFPRLPREGGEWSVWKRKDAFRIVKIDLEAGRFTRHSVEASAKGFRKDGTR